MYKYVGLLIQTENAHIPYQSWVFDRLLDQMEMEPIQLFLEIVFLQQLAYSSTVSATFWKSCVVFCSRLKLQKIRDSYYNPFRTTSKVVRD